MKPIAPLRILALLILVTLGLPVAASAKPRLMVHLSRCSGPELKKDKVLVIDLSAFHHPQQELERVLEENHLIAIRERTLGDEGSPKHSLDRVAKAAGKERCDAVIVMRRDDSPQADPVMGGGSRRNGTSTSLSAHPAQVEVIFAEPKPDPKTAQVEESKDESG